MRWCFFSILGLLCVAAKKPIEVQPMNLALNVRVAATKEEWATTVANMQALLKFAKEQKMGRNVELMLQSGTKKIEQTAEEMTSAIDLKAATEARNKKLALSSFTDPSLSVKPLKNVLAAKKEKGVPRYSLNEFNKKAKAKKIKFDSPFIIVDGVSKLTELQQKFTSKNLVKPEYEHVKVRYVTPAQAKKSRSFEKPQPGQEEQLEAHWITFERFFVNCFNLRAKADFKKSPGANTEHCENTMDAAVLGTDIYDYNLEATSKFPWLQQLERNKVQFLNKHKEELAQALPDGGLGQLNSNPTRHFVFGPSGSGEHLRAEGMPMVDGLLHGRRRWLFMHMSDFRDLQRKAAQDMEPASAFVFFESQLEELKEDHDLGSRKLPFFECNQDVGDLLFIPSGMVRVSLALQDSASYLQKVAVTKQQAVEDINSQVWSPNSGMLPDSFRALACTSFDTAKLRKLLNKPMPQGIIAELMKNSFGSAAATSLLSAQVLAQCASVAGTDLFLETQCKQLWSACADSLKRASADNNKKFPDFLTRYLEGFKTEL